MKKAIVTIGSGREFSELLHHTAPFMKGYALKTGAEYIQLGSFSDTDPWTMENKFAIEEVAMYYDRTLYVDADCWIRPSCPDVFGLPCPMMHNDKPFIAERGTLAPCVAEFNAVLRSQHLQEIADPKYLLGAGVVLCSQESSWIWRAPEFPLPNTHCAEQYWVQHQAEVAGVHIFDPKFNTQYWFKNYRELKKDAYIVHLASAPYRVDSMRNLIHGLDE